MANDAPSLNLMANAVKIIGETLIYDIRHFVLFIGVCKESSVLVKHENIINFHIQYFMVLLIFCLKNNMFYV